MRERERLCICVCVWLYSLLYSPLFKPPNGGRFWYSADYQNLLAHMCIYYKSDYICICVCIYRWSDVKDYCSRPLLYIYIYIFICVYICSYMHLMFMCSCRQSVLLLHRWNVHAQVFSWADYMIDWCCFHLYMCVYKYTCAHTNFHLYIRVYIHTYWYVCLHINTYIYLHMKCIYINRDIYTYVYTYVHIFIYVCVCVCVYECVYPVGRVGLHDRQVIIRICKDVWHRNLLPVGILSMYWHTYIDICSCK